MKFMISTLFFLLTISLGFGLPARDPKDDVEYVPISRRTEVPSLGAGSDLDYIDPNFKDVVDTGYRNGLYVPYVYNPMSIHYGLFGNFEDFWRRLRESFFNNWWSSIPQPGDENWDQPEGNSTSEVKVIDGHKVVVNDTVYTKKDDSGNAIFRVRILNIHPVDSSEENDGKDNVTTPGSNSELPNYSEKTNYNNEKNSSEDGNKSEDKGSPEIIEKKQEENEISGNIDSSEVKPSVASI